MTSVRITTVATALAIAVAAVAAAVPVASAKGGDDVRVAGTCTQSSTAKLKLGREDGRLEVEFEVDQNRNGVPWKVTLRRNGTLVASTIARTRAPSGSFSLQRRIDNRAGSDTLVATARNRSTDERCKAKVTI